MEKVTRVLESFSSYYRARYYDQNLGRFIGQDPIGFWGGVNFYAYVAGGPIGRRDCGPQKFYPTEHLLSMANC